MKTEGLTLIEAERARVAGVCKCYQRKDWDGNIVFDGFRFNISGSVEPLCSLNTQDILATDYRLINPIVPTKTTPVNVHMVIDPEGNRYYDYENIEIDLSAFPPGSRVVELTGVDVVPVEEPTQKEWVFTGVVWSEAPGGYQFPICNGDHPEKGFVGLYGKTGTLTFVEDPK